MNDRQALSTQDLRRNTAPGLLDRTRRPGSALLPVTSAILIVACLAAALWQLPAETSAVHILIAVAATLTLAASVFAIKASRQASPHNEAPSAASIFGERLEHKLEHLQDVQWALSEDEARLRDLIEAQAELIVRRDTQGHLTFVNTAFCNAFGINAPDVLGSQFQPPCLERETAEDETSESGRSRSYELVETLAGQRWICWETSAPRTSGTLCEIQVSGRDVTAERAADEALKIARDQAESASRAKSRFLAAMSHEIRTPMNGILGMAALLRETTLAADQDTYVQAIDQSARNLLTLINEILDFSKIEAGKLTLSQAPFCLQDTVQAAVELTAPLAEEKGLEIVWFVEPGCRGRFLGDEARTRQILLNLISNAVKFTDKGSIAVRVARAAPQAADGSTMQLDITVQDTGIGLSGSDLAMIFAEFEQADAAIKRQRGGTGLGLAISMQLARAMRGGISVNSTLGNGSAFTLKLSLPVCADANLAAPSRTAAAVPPSVVLIASDREAERTVLATLIGETGITPLVSTASTARDALERAAGRNMPVTKLIIEGGEDPGVAGELLSYAQQLAQPAPLQGLVIFSPLTRNNLEAFRTKGYSGYLVRPVRPHSLLTALHGSGWPNRSDDEAARQLQWPAQDANAKPCRVLLAEDNAVNRLVASRILERAGCQISLAGNGIEAIDAVRPCVAGDEPPFDLILMDIQMPLLDGLGAASAIRQLYSQYPQLVCPPIVAITANAFAEDRVRCLDAGMDDYLAKPFDVPELEAILDKWNASRRHQPAA